MQFRDIKPGYPVFILDKESVTATQGKAVSVGMPRIQTPNTFGQTSSLVVDIAIEADGTTKTYTIPETAAVTYAGTLALSTDKDGILREINALKSAATEALAKVDAQKAVVEKCDIALAEWDTTYAEKRKQDERISGIETEVKSLSQQIRDFINTFKT